MLQAVTQLLAHFEAYRDIPKIRELADKVDNLKSTLKSHVFSDFSRSARLPGVGPVPCFLHVLFGSTPPAKCPDGLCWTHVVSERISLHVGTLNGGLTQHCFTSDSITCVAPSIALGLMSHVIPCPFLSLSFHIQPGHASAEGQRADDATAGGRMPGRGRPRLLRAGRAHALNLQQGADGVPADLPGHGYVVLYVNGPTGRSSLQTVAGPQHVDFPAAKFFQALEQETLKDVFVERCLD